MSKYKIIAIVGKAGSGKDTLQKALVDAYPDAFNAIISCTTRPKRENEKDGVNYHFLDNQQFAELVMDGRMLEATVFRDWCYGTSEDSLDPDKYNIGVFNPEGVEILADDDRIDLMIIYLKCNDKKRIERQLDREVFPDVDEIIRRYQTDKKDFEKFEHAENCNYNELRSEDWLDREVAKTLSLILQWSIQINPNS